MIISHNLEWEKLTGVDCYQGKGADPIQPDPFSNSLTLDQCQAVCEGIIRKSSDVQGSGICYKRRNIVIGNCVKDPVWDLHKKPGSGGRLFLSLVFLLINTFRIFINNCETSGYSIWL